MGQKAKFSFRKRSSIAAISACFALFFLIFLAWAATYEHNLIIYLNSDSTIAETAAANETFNITITNATASYGPIIYVNITLNDSFSFTGNNVTNSTSSRFVSSGAHLNWSNTTSAGLNGSYSGSSSIYFSFNSTVANFSNGTSVSFNVSVTNLSGDVNYSLLSFKVRDTNIPKVNFTNGTESNGTINNTNYIFVNATFMDNAIGSFSVAYFQLYNSTNDLIQNISNSTLSADNATWINFTTSNTRNLTKGDTYRVNVTFIDTGGNTNTTDLRNISLGFLLLNITRNNTGTYSSTNTTKFHVSMENKNSTNSTNVTQDVGLKLNVTKAITVGTNRTLNFYFFVPENVVGQSLSIDDNSTLTTSSISSSNTSNVPGITKAVVLVENLSATTIVNVTLTMTFNGSKWINSSFNSSLELNKSANLNSIQNFTVNLTINQSAVAGFYSGFLNYSSSPDLGTDFFNVTVNVSAPEVLVKTNYSDNPPMLKEGTLYVKINSGTGNHSLNVTINNTGNSILSGISHTWVQSNFTNTSSSTANVTMGYDSALNFSSTLEQFNTTYLIFNLNATHASNGNYTNVLYINTSDGQPYKNQSITFNVYVSDSYNVIITDIVGNGTNPRPNNTILLSVNISYQNGTPATGLSETNFTIYDLVGTVALNKWNSSSSTSSNWNFTSFDFSNNANGIYNFTIRAYRGTSADAGYGGTHTLNVSLSNSGVSSSVNKGIGNRTYVLNASNISVSGDSKAATEGSNTNYTMTVTNNGNLTVENVTVTASESSSSISLTTSSCTISSITAGNSGTCKIEVKGDGDTTGSIAISLTANGTDGSVTYSVNGTANVTKVNEAASTSSSSGASGGAGASNTSASTTAPSTTTQTQVQKDYSVSYSGMETVSITQGGNSAKTITITNNGKKDLTNLQISLSSSELTSFYSFLADMPAKLAVNEQFTLSVNLTVPENAEIKKYPVTATATSSENLNVAETFYIQVTPNQETSEKINQSFYDLSEQYEGIAKDIDKLLGKLDESSPSYTALKANKNDLEKLLNETQTALKGQNFLAAYEFQEQIKSLLAETKKLIDEAKESQGISIWVWATLAFVIIAGAAAGFYYYLWLPPKGYSPEGPVFQNSQSSQDSGIKSKFKKFIEKLKSIFKRKPKEATPQQYTSNDASKDRWA